MAVIAAETGERFDQDIVLGSGIPKPEPCVETPDEQLARFSRDAEKGSRVALLSGIVDAPTELLEQVETFEQKRREILDDPTRSTAYKVEQIAKVESALADAVIGMEYSEIVARDKELGQEQGRILGEMKHTIDGNDPVRATQRQTRELALSNDLQLAATLRDPLQLADLYHEIKGSEDEARIRKAGAALVTALKPLNKSADDRAHRAITEVIADFTSWTAQHPSPVERLAVIKAEREGLERSTNEKYARLRTRLRIKG